MEMIIIFTDVAIFTTIRRDNLEAGGFIKGGHTPYRHVVFLLVWRK